MHERYDLNILNYSFCTVIVIKPETKSFSGMYRNSGKNEEKVWPMMWVVWYGNFFIIFIYTYIETCTRKISQMNQKHFFFYWSCCTWDFSTFFTVSEHSFYLVDRHFLFDFQHVPMYVLYIPTLHRFTLSSTVHTIK